MIWAFVAIATVFWGMRLFVRADPIPSNAVVASDAVQMRGDLSGLLGAEPVATVAAAPQTSSRFRLLGVMAAKAGPDGSTPGVALISIDGKPARAFTAGARVEDQLVLQNVSLRSASIGAAQGGSSFVLEIPALPAPATGALPRVAIEPASPPPVQAPAMVQRPVGATNSPPGSRPPGPAKINPNTSR
ncbi:MAG: hypothetical protein H7Z15_18335 [Rhizobacter sp.]|nr:hypothetical protein [Rhizobacter sp.]